MTVQEASEQGGTGGVRQELGRFATEAFSSFGGELEGIALGGAMPSPFCEFHPAGRFASCADCAESRRAYEMWLLYQPGPVGYGYVLDGDPIGSIQRARGDLPFDVDVRSAQDPRVDPDVTRRRLDDLLARMAEGDAVAAEMPGDLHPFSLSGDLEGVRTDRDEVVSAHGAERTGRRLLAVAALVALAYFAGRAA